MCTYQSIMDSAQFSAVNECVNICLLDLSASIIRVVSPDTYTK